ncbi:ABC transporter permease [Butyrivibrio sp. NC3005]|uniref:ABC transporter permease n=1 Tax=Butyrivibrio sp. NC3005 TaxID=1280685 RepID=UPI00042A031B|nr:ABC transporter permease subunit [Butyrivibrio sp. NC3005]
MKPDIKRFFEKKKRIPIWSILIWIIIWQLLAMYLNSDILLSSPLQAAVCLFSMMKTQSYWSAVFFSFFRIMSGFVLAVTVGILFCVLSYISSVLRDFISFPISVVKSTPVASFIILVLIWIPSKNISVFISFLMAFPIIYTNLLQGLYQMDEKMLELSKIFRLSFIKQVRYIYIPHVLPFFKAACMTSLGLCVKSGVAAEIIGLPKGSIGENLYEAKIYLSTPEMFAWTVTIIVLGIIMEKIVMMLINKIVMKLEGMNYGEK